MGVGRSLRGSPVTLSMTIGRRNRCGRPKISGAKTCRRSDRSSCLVSAARSTTAVSAAAATGVGTAAVESAAASVMSSRMPARVVMTSGRRIVVSVMMAVVVRRSAVLVMTVAVRVRIAVVDPAEKEGRRVVCATGRSGAVSSGFSTGAEGDNQNSRSDKNDGEHRGVGLHYDKDRTPRAIKTIRAGAGSRRSSGYPRACSGETRLQTRRAAGVSWCAP